jgi:ribosomal protein S18 acetylase RimI-like enzyme
MVFLHRITGWNDPKLGPLMNIVQSSFPANEQMRWSWWIDLLRELSHNAPSSAHRVLLAATEDENPDALADVVGMAHYEIEPSDSAPTAPGICFLYYLAVAPGTRSKGIGSALYRQIVERTLTNGDCTVLLFEVEDPAEMAKTSAEAKELAERRIAFYQRNGARLLNGIHYELHVGWQPPVPMRIMLHSLVPLTPQEGFDRVKGSLNETLRQIAPLEWG